MSHHFGGRERLKRFVRSIRHAICYHPSSAAHGERKLPGALASCCGSPPAASSTCGGQPQGLGEEPQTTQRQTAGSKQSAGTGDGSLSYFLQAIHHAARAAAFSFGHGLAPINRPPPTCQAWPGACTAALYQLPAASLITAKWRQLVPHYLELIPIAKYVDQR